MARQETQQVIEGGAFETMGKNEVIYATSTAPHHKEGATIWCSRATKEKMIEQGWATEKAPAGKKQKEDKV